MNLFNNFKKRLVQSGLIQPGEKVFIACSGGPDSVVLFKLLESLSRDWKLKLGLIHVNHQLRGRESKLDELFVKKLAAEAGIPFILGQRSVKKFAKSEKYSLEEAARELRYEFFNQAAKKRKIPKIAVAHTKDDQAETVLMRILKGTGLRGLEGIRSQLDHDHVTIVRPLLSFTKKEVLTYLTDHKIPFREDASNQSMKFVRNRIRKKLLPMLEKEFNPRMKDALARIPEIVSQENAMMIDLEGAAWRKVFVAKRGESVTLARDAFLKFPAPLQFRLLNRALRRIDPKSGLSFDRWQELAPGLERKRFRWSLPRDIDLLLSPFELRLYKKKTAL